MTAVFPVAAATTGTDHPDRTVGGRPHRTPTDGFVVPNEQNPSRPPDPVRTYADPYDHDEEAPLIAAARAGDVEAREQLFERYHLVIYDFLRRHLRSAQDAEDLTQDTMVNAFIALDRLGHEQFRRWIFMIAINLYRSWCRRLYTRSGTRSLEAEHERNGFEIPDVTENADVWIAGVDSDPTVLKAMDALTVYQRRVVVEHFVKGMTFREIAIREMGVAMTLPIGTVPPEVERRAEALKQVSQRGKSAFVRRYAEITGDERYAEALLLDPAEETQLVVLAA